MRVLLKQKYLCGRKPFLWKICLKGLPLGLGFILLWLGGGAFFTGTSLKLSSVAKLATSSLLPPLPLPVHGISLYGPLRYPPSFDCFSYATPQGQEGGTFKMAVVGRSFTTVNPFLFPSHPAAGAGFPYFLPFDSLMERSLDEPFSLYGRLAKTVQLADDASWIVFHLRPQAVFHDNSPLTAHDVAFTYRYFKEFGSPSRKNLARRVESVEVLSRHTVKFSFTKVAGNYDRQLPFLIATMPVLSQRTPPVASRPFQPLMGSGPYRIRAVQPGRAIVYEKNPFYWGKNLPVMKGRYHAQRLVFDYFQTDAMAFEAFKAKKLTYWKERQPSRWQQLHETKNPRLVMEASPAFFPGMQGLVLNTRRFLFQDKRVRQALFLLFDAPTINEHFLLNAFQPFSSFFPPPFQGKGPLDDDERQILSQHNLPHPLTHLFFEKNMSFDKRVSQALFLFKEAGWVLRHGQLVHEKTKKPFSFKIFLRNKENFKEIFYFLHTLKKEVGIHGTVEVMEASLYYQRIQSYDFDAIVRRWPCRQVPGLEQYINWASFFAHIPSRNYAGVQSAEIDVLCDVIAKASTYEKIVSASRLLDRFLLAGFYVIPFFYPKENMVSYWKGWHAPFFLLNVHPFCYGWFDTKDNK